jgi:hypothetical protein
VLVSEELPIRLTAARALVVLELDRRQRQHTGDDDHQHENRGEHRIERHPRQIGRRELRQDAHFALHERGEHQWADERREAEHELAHHREEREVRFAACSTRQRIDHHLQHRHAEPDDEQAANDHEIPRQQRDRQRACQVERECREQHGARTEGLDHHPRGNRDHAVRQEERERQESRETEAQPEVADDDRHQRPDDVRHERDDEPDAQDVADDD